MHPLQRVMWAGLGMPGCHPGAGAGLQGGLHNTCLRLLQPSACACCNSCPAEKILQRCSRVSAHDNVSSLLLFTTSYIPLNGAVPNNPFLLVMLLQSSLDTSPHC